MANVLTAIDEPGSTILFDRLSNAAGTLTVSGSSQWWLFSTNYTMAATLDTGPVDLIVSNRVRLVEFTVNWDLHATLHLDLNKILPPIYLPQVKVEIKWTKKPPFIKITISVNWVHYPWPVVAIPFHVRDRLTATADLQLVVRNDAVNWYVLAKMLGTPNFNWGLATGAILAALGAVLGLVLAPIPLIGPWLSVAVPAILAGVGAAGVAGLLAPPLSQLLQGREFMLYQRPRLLPLLPYVCPNDPDVNLQITMIEASIVNTGEDELQIPVSVHE